MKEIFIVKMGAENQASMYEFAFEDLEDAKVFRDLLDRNKGASATLSTIHVMALYAKDEVVHA